MKRPAPAEAPPNARAPAFLVVFDFDWSLINENSDTFVVGVLDPAGKIWAAAEKKHDEGVQWTALMDWVVSELHAVGHTAADMEAALGRVPVLSTVLSAVTLAQERGAELRILSDANTLYIRWILAALGLSDVFSMTVTNPAEVDPDGRLRISPHQPSEGAPHGCLHCPSNLCKGAVMQGWLDEMGSAARVAYVGDGGGDFCPCTRMARGDTVFARRKPHDRLLRKCRQLPRRPGAARVVARVVEWGDPDDGGPSLADGFRAFFEPAGDDVPRAAEAACTAS